MEWRRFGLNAEREKTVLTPKLYVRSDNFKGEDFIRHIRAELMKPKKNPYLNLANITSQLQYCQHWKEVNNILEVVSTHDNNVDVSYYVNINVSNYVNIEPSTVVNINDKMKYKKLKKRKEIQEG